MAHKDKMRSGGDRLEQEKGREREWEESLVRVRSGKGEDGGSENWAIKGEKRGI